MGRFFDGLGVLALSAAAFAQSVTVSQSAPNNQNLTPEQQATVVRLSNLQKNFGNSSMNSPGVALSLKEISRRRATDRTLVTYELYASGLPRDHTFTIFEVKISGQFNKFVEGVTLDSDGRAICAGRKGTCGGRSPNRPIDLVFFAGEGEPKRLALVSEDHQLKGFVAVVPFPNGTRDKNCHLESVIGTPRGEITYIQGSGFEPNEELASDAESYGEKNHFVVKAEADGTYFSTTMPNVLGKTSGITTFEVKGKNCEPKLTFSWGTYQLK
jgi:hypothetical protein